MKPLFYTALITSIIGLIILFAIKPEVSPQSLVIQGKITNIDHRGKVNFITFIPDDFLVVSFKDLNLEPGQHTLIGKLQSYKGKVEFIVEDVK